MSPDPQIILDAHEDIAWNALQYGRDFAVGAYQKRQQEANTEIPQRNGVATIGLPDALLGRVGIIFGTIFSLPAWAKFESNDEGYETAAQAYQMGMRQLDVYHRLADDHERIVLVQTQADLSAVLATWAEGTDFAKHKVGIVLLMESADPIQEPKAFEEWYEHGVRIVGPAWSATRYSGGTTRAGRGPGPLTNLGQELLEVMESFNAILDVSHMSEQAFFEALDRYGGPIIASHSNTRRFRDTDRHLTDDMIRRLMERNGVIGVVPFNAFLRNDYAAGDPKQRTPLSKLIDVIDHLCQVSGSAQHVGIGSDFDGGFGSKSIPAEMDTVADLQLIGPALAARGYTPDDIVAVLSGNFLRILRAALP